MRFTILLAVLTILIWIPFTGLCDDAIVLNYTTNIEVKEKKCIRTETVIIRINNPKGDKYASFNIQYSKNYKLRKLSGEIFDVNNNSIRKLSKKDITSSSLFNNITFYNDNLVKRFSLKHNNYPYIVKVEYKHEIAPYLYIATWNPVWNPDINTSVADLNVTFPTEFEFRTNVANINKPQITATKKGKNYHWHSNYTKLKTDDILAPSISDQLPSVSIIPVNFNYIKPGSFKTWKSYGEWQLLVDEGLNDLTAPEMQKIDQITSGINDPRKLISVLYHYLQDNTRYVNVSVKLGGLQPYPASYVCTNRFGDCKALSNYMKALLTYKGIKSYKIDVYAGDIPDKIYEGFPSQQFNHVILAVPLANDTIWLECTSNVMPVNYLGTFTQNRPVLLIEPNKSRIVKTPALTVNDVTTSANYSFSPADDNQQYSVNASLNLKGEIFEKVITIMKNWNENDKKEYFNNFLNFKNYHPDKYSLFSPDRDSCFVTFQTSGSCNQITQTVGEYTKVDLPPLNLPEFEKIKDRESPVSIYIPLAQIDSITYNFNSDKIQLTTEKNILIESKYGKLEMDISVNNGQLNIIRKYELPTQHIPFEDYKSFYDFINQIKNKGGSLFIKM